MIRAPNHYELLDVSSSATTEQIRSAYLRLMKRYHPDVASERAEAVDFLPRINQVYAALSDPVSRAAYDAELARHQRRRFSPVAATPIRSGNRRARSRQVWAWLAIAGGGAAVAFLSFAGSNAESGRQLGWFQAPAPASDEAHAVPFPALADIAHEARRGAAAKTHKAIEQSKDCFSAARVQDSAAAAQLCVVFDDAFLYSHQSPTAGLPPYFSDVMVKLRHSSALDVAPDDPLLQRLWQASFSALMTNMRPSSASPKMAGGQSEKPGLKEQYGDLPQAGTVADR